jgi:hypothetical protein
LVTARARTRFAHPIFTAGVVAFATLLAGAHSAYALLPQTARDLRVMEDRLGFEMGELRGGAQAVTPILVASPEPYWQESRADFAESAHAALARVFSGSGDLIPCAECGRARVYVSADARTVVQTGEISLSDLARLRERPGFAQAKSLLTLRETPSGIAIRLLALEDGRVLYEGLADGTQTLADAEPPLRLAREMERRKRGESLTYVHIDAGIYPNALVQIKWLEQWGNRNQHLSGLAISAFNPNGALGATYLYMLPFFHRRATLGGIAYYRLDSMFNGGADGGAFAFQGSLNYAFSGAYGAFIAAGSNGVVSIGLSLQNPVLIPFLL